MDQVKRLEQCPCCGEWAIDTSKPVVTFWRCGVCRQAIVKRDGELQPWLNVVARPRRIRTRKRRTQR